MRTCEEIERTRREAVAQAQNRSAREKKPMWVFESPTLTYVRDTDSCPPDAYKVCKVEWDGNIIEWTQLPNE